jgi:NADH-quinone oxidoreductase subunit M
MENLLSIITFIPAVGGLILALFLRGDDAAAQRNAKWLALLPPATFLVSLFLLAGFDPATPGSSSSKPATGSWACNTRWAWTASRSCS